MFYSETSTGSEFLSFFVLYSRILADFLSLLGKWVKLIKFEAENEFFFALGRLKNHKVPHLHPNSTMFMPLDRLQLKIYAFSGKFNVCSKLVLLSQIKICRDFTLQTQIFTQKYRSWLRFYSEFLRKKLAVGGSALDPLDHLGTLMSRLWLVGLFDFGSGSGRVLPKSSGFGSGSGIGCTWLYWAVLVVDSTERYWAVVGLVWWVFRWFMRHIFL